MAFKWVFFVDAELLFILLFFSTHYHNILFIH